MEVGRQERSDGPEEDADGDAAGKVVPGLRVGSGHHQMPPEEAWTLI